MNERHHDIHLDHSLEDQMMELLAFLNAMQNESVLPPDMADECQGHIEYLQELHQMPYSLSDYAEAMIGERMDLDHMGIDSEAAREIVRVLASANSLLADLDNVDYQILQAVRDRIENIVEAQ